MAACMVASWGFIRIGRTLLGQLQAVLLVRRTSFHHLNRKDELAVHVGRQRQLVAIKAVENALAAMPHLLAAEGLAALLELEVSPVGEPHEALDSACGLHLGDPSAWVPNAAAERPYRDRRLCSTLRTGARTPDRRAGHRRQIRMTVSASKTATTPSRNQVAPASTGPILLVVDGLPDSDLATEGAIYPATNLKRALHVVQPTGPDRLLPRLLRRRLAWKAVSKQATTGRSGRVRKR